MSRLASFTLCLLLLGGSVAYADPYGNFLQRLDTNLDSVTRWALTQEGIASIEAIVAQKPPLAAPGSYEAFVKMFDRRVQQLTRWEMGGMQLRLIRALVPATPLLTSATANDYRLFFTSFMALVNRLSRWQISNEGLELVDAYAKIAPPLDQVQAVYELSYAFSAQQIAELESRVSPNGIDGANRRLLGIVRGLQPRLAQAAAPPWTPPQNLPPPAQAGERTVCGRPFLVSQEMAVYTLPRPTPNSLYLLTDGDLVEVDPTTCQVRWLADTVVSFVPHPRRHGLLMIRGNGSTLLLRPNGNVFFVAGDMQRAQMAPGGNGVTLLDRRGKALQLEMSVSGDEQLSIQLGGRQQSGRFRYRTDWRPIQSY